MGEAKGLHGEQLEQQIREVMEQVKIQPVQNRRISALSKGYKQRVGIAQALLGNPEVIILDEPTVGLDPIQIIEIRDLIKELGRSHTVIFSSHILSEVQAICEKIIIIAHGKLVAFGQPDQMERSLLSGNEISFTTDAPSGLVREILSGMDQISHLTLEQADGGLTRAQIKTGRTDVYAVSKELFFTFARRQQALLELTVKKASLEDIFLELTEADPATSHREAEDPNEESEASQP